jgi:hypothetical protein
MSKLSRRVLISSAAALPALAVPAVAADTVTSSDIELQQLGTQLLHVKREMKAINAQARETFSDAESEEELENRCTVANSHLCALMEPIFSRTATSIDGLSVQAVAVTLAAADMWELYDEEAPLDVERRFVEAVCRYTGVEHPAINCRQGPEEAREETVPPLAQSDDPIFEAIEEWKKALEIEEASYRAQKIAKTREEVKDLEDESYDLASVRIELMHAAFRTVPTTLTGLRAKIDFAGDANVTESLQQTHDPKRLKDFLETLYKCTAQLVA